MKVRIIVGATHAKRGVSYKAVTKMFGRKERLGETQVFRRSKTTYICLSGFDT